MECGNINWQCVNRVLEFLGLTPTKVAEEGKRQLSDYLNRNFGGWGEIVEKGVKCGIDAALRALNAVKEEIVKVCRKNPQLIEQLAKLAVKSGARMAIEAGAKGLTKTATKSAVKGTAATATKTLLAVANPVGVAADVAQLGLEVVGQKEAGKMVGKYGNIVSGAMFGGVVGGPPGAAIGAGVGFVVWGTGEVVGGAHWEVY